MIKHIKWGKSTNYFFVLGLSDDEENDNEDEDNIDKDEQEYYDLIKYNKALYRLTRKNELKEQHIKLLELSGVKKSDINTFIGQIEEQNKKMK